MNIPKYITEFRNEIQRKGYRDNSIKNYVACVEAFLHHFNGTVTEPVKVNEAQIKDYLRKFKEHNTQRAVHSAIKTFYKYVCRQPEKFRFIEYCKRSRKLPIVLSVEEIQRLFNACTNIKHRAIVALMYSTGLRVGEVIALKIENIDSSRMVINIINAKGGKDRQVMLNQNLLDLLRNYFKAYHPKEYLFNGQNSPQYLRAQHRAILKALRRKGRAQQAHLSTPDQALLLHTPGRSRHRHQPHPAAGRAPIRKDHQPIHPNIAHTHLAHTVTTLTNSIVNHTPFFKL